MAEKTNDKTIFSLLEVTQSIQKTLSERYTSAFWVKAEMNKLNFYRQSGHCYPELVEKQDGKVIAQIKSHLWRDDYIRANNNFKAVLKEPLKDGIKILFLATVSFDPVHGLALWILDIDPSYTLGDLEKEKQETIRRLKEEGIFNSNKALKLPLLPQRIAIISVETSNGYADFLKVIGANWWNYKIFHLLFPSLLQGDRAVDAICHQLKRIKRIKSHFDVVAIIRGGGGDVGLSCYNHYQLAKETATFPIPVITGIGHATNETVTEMVSFSNAITPTKLAEFLLQKFHNFSVPVRDAERTITDKSNRLIEEAKSKLQSEVKLFRSVAENILIVNSNEVSGLRSSLFHRSQYVLKNEREGLFILSTRMRRGTIAFCNSTSQRIRQLAVTMRKDTRSQISRFKLIVSQLKDKLVAQVSLQFKHTRIELDNTDKNIINMSPRMVLKRGYSITRFNGKAVKSALTLTGGDTLKTTVFEGNIISVVQSINKTGKE
jgi:exodeoxyribonuclease VII large subunit